MVGWNDEKAYQLKAVVDMSDVGIEGLNIAMLYGEFKSAPVNVRMTEWNIIATYVYNNVLGGDISYAKLNDKNDNQNSGSDAGYDRFLARLNYRF